MDKNRVGNIKREFDIIVRKEEDSDVEFWFARELMTLLGYGRWENFENAVTRSMVSCETSGIEVTDHFREVTKMITYIKLLSQQYSKHPKDAPIHIYKVFPFYHCSR